MRLLNVITQRSHRERHLLLQAVVISIAIRLALIILPFRAVQRWICRECEVSRRVDRAERERIVRAVHSATRYLQSERRCLLRGMAVQWMLHRAGQPVALRIGAARTTDGALQAHVWVELDGEVITGGKDAPRIYATFEPAGTASWPA